MRVPDEYLKCVAFVGEASSVRKLLAPSNRTESRFGNDKRTRTPALGVVPS